MKIFSETPGQDTSRLIIVGDYEELKDLGRDILAAAGHGEKTIRFYDGTRGWFRTVVVRKTST